MSIFDIPPKSGQSGSDENDKHRRNMLIAITAAAVVFILLLIIIFIILAGHSGRSQPSASMYYPAYGYN